MWFHLVPSVDCGESKIKMNGSSFNTLLYFPNTPVDKLTVRLLCACQFVWSLRSCLINVALELPGASRLNKGRFDRSTLRRVRSVRRDSSPRPTGNVERGDDFGVAKSSSTSIRSLPRGCGVAAIIHHKRLPSPLVNL